MSFVNSNINTKWMDNHTAPRAPRISEEEWDQHRNVITKLHEEGKTKQEISSVMAQDFNFTPTENQFTTQFKKWKLNRYKKPSKSPLDRVSDISFGPSSSIGTKSQIAKVSNPDQVTHDTPSDNPPLPNPFMGLFYSPATIPERETVDLISEGDTEQVTDPFTDPPRLEVPEPLSDPPGADSPFLQNSVISKVTEAVNSPTVDHEDDCLSDMESVCTIGDPHAVREISSDSAKYTQSEPALGTSSGNDIGITTPTGRSVDDLNDSIYALSIQDSLHDPFADADDVSMSAAYPETTFYSNSVWTNMTSRSELSFASKRGSHIATLTDRSAAIPTYQYLNQLYPRKKLKKLRKFAQEHLFCDYSAFQTLYSILAEADFLRVSLLFSDAFDLYLLAYMLLADKKIEKRIEIHKHLILQALAGCAESARNLSQVRLCQEFLSGLNDYDKNDLLHATGFPLRYWQGHLAALEGQSNHAAACIQTAVAEVGHLPFRDSASVTSMLVREFIARYQYMSLPLDVHSLWLKEAEQRLDNGEFTITIAAALTKLLDWAISKLEKEKLDETVKDCFSKQASACVRSMNGDQIPQYTFMLVVHFYCSWAEENRAPHDGISWVPNQQGLDGSIFIDSETDRMANALDDMRRLRKRGGSTVNEAIDLISKEVEINLLSIFTTLSRMIMEHSPLFASKEEYQNSIAIIKDNATALIKLPGEQLEAAFVKAYFFVNARAPELGSGLHPRRFLRALAVHNMPRRLITSEIGPDWLSDAATVATTSVRSLSRHSTNDSTRRLLQETPEGALPQPSPRSSISVKVRDAIVAAIKRKYQPSISSRHSNASQYGVPTKMLKLQNDATGGTGSTTRNRTEAERDLMMLLGLSMTSLNLCE